MLDVPDEIWGPLMARHVPVEVLIPILMGGEWDFRYSESPRLIRDYYERLGPSRLI